jgi:hypothetical protein
MSKTPGHKIGRDARDGRFIPVSEAHRRPATTIVQVIHNQPSPHKKK